MTRARDPWRPAPRTPRTHRPSPGRGPRGPQPRPAPAPRSNSSLTLIVA